ncbi:hypothetical protein [Nocardia sp. NPDC049149]
MTNSPHDHTEAPLVDALATIGADTDSLRRAIGRGAARLRTIRVTAQ